MEIKLRARLAAYSKIDSIESTVSSIPNEVIDTLFTDARTTHVVTREDVDTLFTPTPDASEGDRRVTYSEIDSLFD